MDDLQAQNQVQRRITFTLLIYHFKRSIYRTNSFGELGEELGRAASLGEFPSIHSSFVVLCRPRTLAGSTLFRLCVGHSVNFTNLDSITFPGNSDQASFYRDSLRLPCGGNCGPSKSFSLEIAGSIYPQLYISHSSVLQGHFILEPNVLSIFLFLFF